MYGGREQFIKVCLVEGLSPEQASDLFGFALRHKINVENDPFMTLALVLGLIREATNLNLKSSRRLAQDAADRTGKELASVVEGFMREGLHDLTVRWVATVGMVGVACLAVTFSLGATVALHQQARTTDFWNTLVNSPDAAAWEQLIKNNRTFPSELACGPQSRNFGIDEGRGFCSIRVFGSPETKQTDWFSAVLLGPSLRLGHYTPLILLAAGLALGTSMILAPFAFQRWRAK